MPKAKKIRAAALSRNQAARHEPLGQVMHDERNKYAKPMRAPKQTSSEEEQPGLLDERSSQKILQLSRQQQLEIQLEEQRKMQQQKRSTHPDSMDSDDEEFEEEEHVIVDEEDDYLIQDNGYVTISESAMGLSKEDEALVASMMSNNNTTGERRTLADMILEKIAEKEAEKRGDFMSNDDEQGLPPLPPKVVEVYTEIGKILSRYTSGKLPKAFKVIPSLSNWEEVLYLTRPDLWTPQAMFAATRIFASNLNPKMAQRFYNLVLLDAVRSDIQTHKKLNYHYYAALNKSVYKPAAFFKGILLPLAKEATLREAAIVASVLQRVSIPSHHSAVALHKLAQSTDYTGAASIFIKTLLQKKYSLPAPVIGSLVQHFSSFLNYDGEDPLPVLWHQALLVFVQRYKHELQDSREVLRKVMKKHFHAKITPEIRRELFGAAAWKDERKLADGDSMYCNIKLIRSI
jgi:essential nuclear protein 1